MIKRLVFNALVLTLACGSAWDEDEDSADRAPVSQSCRDYPKSCYGRDEAQCCVCNPYGFECAWSCCSTK